MGKKVSSTGMYETKSGKLDNQTKAALLEYLTECDEFHKLVCDITGVERKEEKVYIELEKVKADYLYMCERYKQEQVKNKALIQRWKDEEAKRMKTQAALEDSHSHHNNVMNRIKDLLKEVDMPSVKHAIEALKAERVKGKLLAEQYELSTNENDKLEKLLREIEGRYDRIAKGYDNACKEARTTENIRKSLSANYDRLAEDYNRLSTRYNNQKECIAKYIEENELCRRENDKLKLSYNKACEELKVIEKNMDSVSDNYAKLAKSHEYLNECNQNQAKTITNQMNDILSLRNELIEQKELAKKHLAKSEKLQSKLDKASKRYGELIKTISDKSIKLI